MTGRVWKAINAHVNRDMMGTRVKKVDPFTINRKYVHVNVSHSIGSVSSR